MRILVFTGAGVSRESGLETFRDGDGLWENHHVEDVATPEAFARNPALVLEFYNQRRRQIANAKPNPAHFAIAKLEEHFPETVVVTQNIDDLHERAGTKQIIHLHGMIFTGKSSVNDDVRQEWRRDMKLGDLAEDGVQIRPHVVWFGEAVPEMTLATEIAMKADVVIAIGTSLQVYPAAGLVSVARQAEKWLVDPSPPEVEKDIRLVRSVASEGVPQLVNFLLERSH